MTKYNGTKFSPHHSISLTFWTILPENIVHPFKMFPALWTWGTRYLNAQDSASVLLYFHFCHTCSLCRLELIVQFPARGSTQVLLCLFPGVLWLWNFLYSVGPHPVSSLHIFYIFVTLVPFAVWSWWYSSPRGVRLNCYYAFSLVCCGCETSYIVSVYILCQASIYILSVWRGHSCRVRLAKQETLTPPGHLVSPLVCRDPWMSAMVLYCWCHSDSASFILYFT